MLNFPCGLSYSSKIFIGNYLLFVKTIDLLQFITTRGLHKGREIFKSCKIQCLGLRQLDKVYITSLHCLRKSNIILLLYWIYYYVTIKQLKWPSIFLSQEVSSSQAVEKEAFTRVLDNITTNLELSVDVVFTDHHLSIKKLMRTDSRFNHIKHQFDPWHIAKRVAKKIIKAASKKGKPSFYYHTLNTIWLEINEAMNTAPKKVGELSEKT